MVERVKALRRPSRPRARARRSPRDGAGRGRASTPGWRAPPAASARPCPGGRRSCRGAAPRGRRRAGRHVRARRRRCGPRRGSAVVEPLGGDRVVEVARGRRVDGEGRQVAQVAARPGPVRRRAGGGARLALHDRVEAAPQPAVEHQRLEHVARVVRPPEPPDYLAVAPAAPVGAHEHEVARAHPRGGLSRLMRRPRAKNGVGGEETAALLEDGDDRRVPSLARVAAARARATTSCRDLERLVLLRLVGCRCALTSGVIRRPSSARRRRGCGPWA